MLSVAVRTDRSPLDCAAQVESPLPCVSVTVEAAMGRKNKSKAAAPAKELDPEVCIMFTALRRAARAHGGPCGRPQLSVAGRRAETAALASQSNLTPDICAQHCILALDASVRRAT